MWGVWNGFLLGKAKKEDVPCRFCGQKDGDGHLFWECTFPSLQHVRDLPEFAYLMSLDRSNWPRCLLWHGWLPGLNGVSTKDPWATSFGGLASFLLEICLGAYLVDYVDNLVPRVGGLQGFLPRQASSSHSPGVADEAFTGFFRTFPHIKKSAGLVPHSGSELAADSSPSTRRDYDVPMAVVEDVSEPVTESELEDEGEINAWVDAGNPGCLFSRCMVLSGGTSRRSAPSATRRGGVVYSDMSGCFRLLALFTLGFWTLLLRVRVSDKGLLRCF